MIGNLRFRLLLALGSIGSLQGFTVDTTGGSKTYVAPVDFRATEFIGNGTLNCQGSGSWVGVIW
jgi:hypothetical protein